MIPTALAVGTKPQNATVSFAAQSWLLAHGLVPYTPHEQFGEASNLAVEYDFAAGGLKWKPATIATLQGIKQPIMLQHWGSYFYQTSPNTFSWPDPNDPTRKLHQDVISADSMAMHLTRIAAWLDTKGIEGYIMIDEPPHNEKYGLTPEVEKRVIKLCQACALAGLEVGVAVPGPSQLRYWLPRLGQFSTVFWMLNDSDLLAEARNQIPGRRAWLYNYRAAAGLAAKMQAFEFTGLLQWSVWPWTRQNKLPILFDRTDTTVAPRQEMWDLLAELTKLSKPPVQPPLTLESLAEKVRKLEEIVYGSVRP